ncbi:MAG: hypothetical protein LBB41_06210 [Prevotellaceae bacterium]|jgi:hypothetical protein|nr:hypothetical protein [Prevotellaceae bacterium]
MNSSNYVWAAKLVKKIHKLLFQYSNSSLSCQNTKIILQQRKYLKISDKILQLADFQKQILLKK